MMSPRLLFLLLSFSSVVVATSTTSNRGGYKFEASPAMKVELAVWIICTIFFLLEAILCLIALSRVKGRRLTYFLFLVSQLLLLSRSITGIIFIFIENNIYATEPPVNALLLCDAIIDICKRVGQAFLFMATVYLILDRHEAIDYAAGGRIGHIDSRMPLVHYALFMGSIALGIVTAIFSERYDSRLWKGYFDLHPKDQAKENTHVQNLSYAYQGFSDSAGLYVLFFIAITYAAMVRMNVNDKVMKFLLFILAPFQACAVIINVLFSILFSPIGPKYAQTSIGNLQYSTANTALFNVCLLGIGMAILLPGLLRTNWNLKGESQSSVPLQRMRKGLVSG
ncbi:hypothetical protein SCHPADRAFT_953755 [Schizopora paradoxa]|uniref:Family A G protein-coupled receptor-like protein n=1 Tax=Schizopora paradoxa TaxID=27342 RepID=A0A0H2S4E9_9AGAM|nr:hypothetical protein SCHPADRAFT_953755 [Schizopora paradoxa]